MKLVILLVNNPVICAEADTKVLAVTTSLDAILLAKEELATLNDPLIALFKANELVDALATTPDDRAYELVAADKTFISVVFTPMVELLLANLLAKEALAKVKEPLISLAIWAEADTIFEGKSKDLSDPPLLVSLILLPITLILWPVVPNSISSALIFLKALEALSLTSKSPEVFLVILVSPKNIVDPLKYKSFHFLVNDPKS